MARLCYLCNKEVHVWHQNLLKLKLNHSNISICTLFKKMLKNLASHRNVEYHLNCICEECYDQIQDYDMMRSMVILKENALRDLLLATEQSFATSAELKTEVKMEIIETNTDASMNDEPEILLPEENVKPIQPPNKSVKVHQQIQETIKDEKECGVPLSAEELRRVKNVQEENRKNVFKEESSADICLAELECKLRPELSKSESGSESGSESENADMEEQSDQMTPTENQTRHGDCDFSPLSSDEEDEDENSADSWYTSRSSLKAILTSNDYTIVDAMGLPLDSDKMPKISKRKLNTVSESFLFQSAIYQNVL